MKGYKRVTVQLDVMVSEKTSNKEVATLVDRLIAIGEQDAEESIELEEHDEDADVVFDMSFDKSKVVKVIK